MCCLLMHARLSPPCQGELMSTSDALVHELVFLGFYAGHVLPTILARSTAFL